MEDPKQLQKAKRRIVIEDDDDDISTKENKPEQKKVMTTEFRTLRKCLITSSWGDSLMGRVTLDNEWKTTMGFQVREFTQMDGRQKLAPVLQILLILNGKACVETVMTISELESIILKLDKFMLRKSELMIARILIHWVFLFLKTNFPQALVFEFNLRTLGDDCHVGVKTSYWERVFKKDFDLFQGGDGTPFPPTIEAAEEVFREQLAQVNATWVKSV